MCLLITIAAAIAATLFWRFNARARKRRISVLALTYWGAALMWTGDGVFAAAAGEPFFRFSAEDAALGGIVAAIGLVVWGVALLCSRLQRKKTGLAESD